MIQRLLALLCATSLLASNPYYDIVVPYAFSTTLFDVTEDNGDSVSAVGFTPIKKRDSYARGYDDPFSFLASNGSNYGEQMHLIQFDAKGDISFEKKFNLKAYNRATSLVKTANNDYYIGGYTLDGTLILSRIHANGMLAYMKFFGTKNFDRLHKLLPLRDGGVLALGTSATSRDISDNIFEGGLGLNDIYLTRFDKEGNRRWSKKYGTQDDDECIDVAEAYDGSLIVLAQRQKGASRKIMLLRISENGDKIWHKSYKKESSFRAHTLTSLKDGNFLALLSDNKERHHRAIIFDKERNIIDEKRLDFGFEGVVVTEIKEHLNGTFSGVGYAIKRGNRHAIVFHLSRELQLQWIKLPYSGGYSSLYGIDIMRSGDIVAVGSRKVSQAEVDNMWIIKLHSDGTYALRSTDDNELFNTLYTTFKDEIASGEVTLLPEFIFTSPAILFEAGEDRLPQAKRERFITLAKKLLHFLYLHKEHIASIEIDGYASKEWLGADYDERYINNLELSARRALYIHTLLYSIAPKEVKEMLQRSSKSGANSYAKQLKTHRDNRASREVEIKINLK